MFLLKKHFLIGNMSHLVCFNSASCWIVYKTIIANRERHIYVREAYKNMKNFFPGLIDNIECFDPNDEQNGQYLHTAKMWKGALASPIDQLKGLQITMAEFKRCDYYF
jgi:hypothetical protein